MEQTFRIICKTDLYNAQRHAGFNRFTGIKVEYEGLSLKQAYERLTYLLQGFALGDIPNWGIAVANAHKYDQSLEAYPTHADGTRSFSYDIYTYQIEAE